MVDAQKRLLTEQFGIEKLHAIVGMQAFEWGVRYPDLSIKCQLHLAKQLLRQPSNLAQSSVPLLLA